MPHRWRRRVGLLGSERGAALFAAILAMLLLSTMMVAYVVLAEDETLLAQYGRDTTQASLAADGGANHGRWMLAQRLRVDLPRQVAATAKLTMQTALEAGGVYSTRVGAAQFLVDLATPQNGPGPAFAVCGGETECHQPSFSALAAIPENQKVRLHLDDTLNGAPVATDVIVAVHPNLVPNPTVTNFGTGALFTYLWWVASTASPGRATQVVFDDSAISANPSGSFTIALNSNFSNFVQYAHFIDQMDATQAWISFRHVYTGPVHTNTRFNILGNPTGPAFRSGATQTLNDIRFNNGGSPITVAQDSTANDWPLLGAAPGVACKVTDCTGLTRGFSATPGANPPTPVPFPGGSNSQDRTNEMCTALAVALCTATPPTPPCGAACQTVLVSGSTAPTGTLAGGIYVDNGAAGVMDLRLASTATGQSIVINTAPGRRTIVQENRTANQTTVARQCIRQGSSGTTCAAASTASGTWIPDTTATLNAPNQQTFTGVFSPNPGTDHGVLFVANGPIGQAGTLNGLRTGDENGLSPAAAIYQDPATPSNGMRLTVVADRDIWITGPLKYTVDPRGPDGAFSAPTPGDPSGDDQLNVQNVLGIVSWGNGTGVSGGVRLSSALTGDLPTQAIIMAPNLGGAGAPSGQYSFDDPNGSYRGINLLLGGVIQKTMGTFGVPGTPGLGYARNWVYDERFRYRGLTPPNFPGFDQSFTAVTSLGIDSYTWRQGRF